MGYVLQKLGNLSAEMTFISADDFLNIFTASVGHHCVQFMLIFDPFVHFLAGLVLFWGP